MGARPADEFAALLDGLDPDALQQFVARLWDARGHRTEVGDGVVVAADRFGSEQVLAVAGAGGANTDPSADADTDADAVIAPGDAHPSDAGAGARTRVIDAADLHALCSYAIEPADREALAREFFDGEIPPRPAGASAPDTTPATAADDPGPTDNGDLGSAARLGADGRGWLIAAASVAVALLLAGGLVAGSVVPMADGSPGADGAVGDAAPGDDPQWQESPADSPNATDGPADDGSEVRQVDGPFGESDEDLAVPAEEALAIEGAPGLAPDGSIDEDRLAKAHVAGLRNASYRLTIVYREFQDGTPVGVQRETVWVERPGVYTSTIERSGTTTQAALVIADAPSYADGTTRYDRLDGDDVEYAARPASLSEEGRQLKRVAKYVEWYLSVRQSTIRDVTERGNETFYWVTVDGDPWVGVTNTTGTAVIDSNGVVHELRRRYETPQADSVAVSVTIRYTEIGETTVDPPPWYPAARNATAPISWEDNATETNATATATPTAD